MHAKIGAGCFAFAMIGLVSWSHAGPERVALPADYAASFIHVKTLDKRDQDPDVVRQIFLDPKAAMVAQPGAPLPQGTRLVMVDQFAATDGNGNTLIDRDGKMVPTGQLKKIFVSEKRSGFGDGYDEELRNGDWEFAVFKPDGSRWPDVNFDKCRECHVQAERTDFTFSVFPNMEAIKR